MDALDMPEFRTIRATAMPVCLYLETFEEWGGEEEGSTYGSRNLTKRRWSWLRVFHARRQIFESPDTQTFSQRRVFYD